MDLGKAVDTEKLFNWFAWHDKLSINWRHLLPTQAQTIFCLFVSGHAFLFCNHTLPETNIAPENWWLGDYKFSILEKPIFITELFNFRECTLLKFTWFLRFQEGHPPQESRSLGHASQSGQSNQAAHHMWNEASGFTGRDNQRFFVERESGVGNLKEYWKLSGTTQGWQQIGRVQNLLRKSMNLYVSNLGIPQISLKDVFRGIFPTRNKDILSG